MEILGVTQQVLGNKGHSKINQIAWFYMKLSKNFMTRLLACLEFQYIVSKLLFNIFNKVGQPFCCCFSVSKVKKCLLSIL